MNSVNTYSNPSEPDDICIVRDDCGNARTIESYYDPEVRGTGHTAKESQDAAISKMEA